MPAEGIQDGAAGPTLGPEQGGRIPRLTPPHRPPRPRCGSRRPALSPSECPRHALTSREPVTDVL